MFMPKAITSNMGSEIDLRPRSTSLIKLLIDAEVGRHAELGHIPFAAQLPQARSKPAAYIDRKIKRGSRCHACGRSTGGILRGRLARKRGAYDARLGGRTLELVDRWGSGRCVCWLHLGTSSFEGVCDTRARTTPMACQSRAEIRNRLRSSTERAAHRASGEVCILLGRGQPPSNDNRPQALSGLEVHVTLGLCSANERRHSSATFLTHTASSVD